MHAARSPECPPTTPELAPEKIRQEAMCLMEGGFAAWGRYLGALAEAKTPAELAQANLDLFALGMNMPALAAGTMLRRGGLRAPLLCDG